MSRAKRQTKPKTAEPENNEPKPLKRGIRRNGLTPRQQRFVSAYLINFNASEAARAAGYKGKWAHTVGPRMSANVRIQEAITERLAGVMGAEFATVKHKVLVELQKEAFESESLIEDVGPKGGTVTKANPNKMKALELLAKYAGLLIEKHEHTGKDGGPIEYQTLPETAKE